MTTTTTAPPTATTRVHANGRNNEITNGSTTTNIPSSSGQQQQQQQQQQPLSQQALFYMSLLALQFGLQPILARRFTSPEVCKSTVLMVQEVLKFFIAGSILHMSGSTQQALKGWTLSSWISVAVIPAGLYSIQNMCALLAYQNLDALTFNVLNQTKTLSAALCVYVLMGRTQSHLQIVALLLLLLSALVMEKIVQLDSLGGMLRNMILHILRMNGGSNDDNNNNGRDDDTTTTTTPPNWDTTHFTHGVAPILMASFISGLAGALTQKNLQTSSKGGHRRNAYLFSMELCVCSLIIMTLSLGISPDGQNILAKGFFHGWTCHTLIPILLNSIGGILVGLVTQHAGSVRKGFALIFGIFLSGLVQELLLSTNNSSQEGGGHVSKEQVLGGTLAALSLWMHATNPPSAVATRSSSSQVEQDKKTKTE